MLLEGLLVKTVLCDVYGLLGHTKFAVWWGVLLEFEYCRDFHGGEAHSRKSLGLGRLCFGLAGNMRERWF